MPQTRVKGFVSLILAFAAFIYLSIPNTVKANPDLICAVNSTCTLGEFLHNDDLTVITNATCTLNGRTPSNAVYFYNTSAPHISDGRYGLTFSTTGLALGTYPTELCCVTGAQTLCVDKSFIISATQATQSDIDSAVTSIKGASNKDLSEVSTQVGTVKTTVDSISTSMSTLVADIWTNSTSSLNNLLSNIWTTSGRTLTSASLTTGQLATSANVTDAQASIKGSSNKDLTQVSGEVADIQTSVNSISTIVNSLNLQISSNSANVTLLIQKWGSYSMSDVISSLATVTSNLGTTSDTCLLNDTILGRLKCLTDKWGSNTAGSIYTAAVNAQTAADSMRAELDYNGKSTTAYADLLTLNSNLNTVAGLVGGTGDSAATQTLFGKIKKVQDTVETLDNSSTDLSGLLAKWGDYTASDIYDKVKDISSDISNVNTVNNVNSILNSTTNITTDVTDLKNSILALMALVKQNKKVLERVTSQPVIQSWLEEGSIIFKNMLTNPTGYTREATLKFYLPKEAATKDIMKMDPGLTVNYDAEQDALQVLGTFTLAPNETKIVSVEVNDVWKITDSEIDALKTETTELFEVLKGTAYFAQGSTLKSSILVSLEKISRLQEEAVTPEARIKAYRESSSEMTSVESQISDLKSLVTSVSSSKNLFGFVGGSQLISVWGIVGVMVAGFAFLAMFMKQLVQSQLKPVQESQKEVKLVPKKIKFKKSSYEKIMLGLILVFIIGGSILYGLIIFRKNQPSKESVKGVQTEYQKPVITTTPIPALKMSPETASSSGLLGKFVVLADDIISLTLRAKPDRKSSTSSKANRGDVYIVIDQVSNPSGNWSKLSLNKEVQGWGLSKFFEEAPSATFAASPKTATESSVLIMTKPDLTIINIRNLPNVNSKIIQRVSGGKTLQKVSESGEWIEIKVSSTTGESSTFSGWINKSVIVTQ